jgi:hypothetical protein
MDTLEPIARLTKDLANAARTLSAGEARFLVDAYYAMQENRIRTHAQVRALTESNEPHDVLAWLAAQDEALEGQIKRALGKYAESKPVGEWALSVKGIGPVITAGLLAHIDITKAPTVGHIWRFAGLDPTVTWDKGQKRPWNASLKTLCWKIGESFVKVCNAEDAFYGHVYAQRKELETRRNEAGEYAEQAKAMLAKKKFRNETDAKKHYEAGRLPPAHIHARAKRYAVKLFLAHYHEVAYKDHYKTEPPLPYAIAHLGHAHKIAVPTSESSRLT